MKNAFAMARQRKSLYPRSTLFSPTDLKILISLGAGKTQAEIGAELHLEQPAISKLVRAAENRAGLPLVRQEGRRLSLTSAGRELAREAVTILAQFDRLDRVLTALRDGSAGPVRIIASSTPGSYVLPALIGEFLRSVPGAKVDLEVVPVNQLWEVFLQGSYDFAVVPQMTFPIELIAEPLYNEPIVLFAAPGSKLTKRSTLTFEDLHEETLIGKFIEAYWGQIVRELERRGFHPANKIELLSYESVKRMVEQGIGIGISFGSSVERDLKDKRLHRLPIVDPALNQRFALAKRPDTPDTPISIEFRTFLHRHIHDA